MPEAGVLRRVEVEQHGRLFQACLLGVGQGVVDSTVDTGRADLHPVKRALTTGTYLAVAVFGTEADRDFVRKSVRKIHARITSSPGAEVRYSANSPALQLWVAVCLLEYFIDQHEFLYGLLTEEQYARAPFATARPSRRR
nr:oxygenase MpaB family protein [Rhodococcus pyridinivorans]